MLLTCARCTKESRREERIAGHQRTHASGPHVKAHGPRRLCGGPLTHGRTYVDTNTPRSTARATRTLPRRTPTPNQQPTARQRRRHHSTMAAAGTSRQGHHEGMVASVPTLPTTVATGLPPEHPAPLQVAPDTRHTPHARSHRVSRRHSHWPSTPHKASRARLPRGSPARTHRRSLHSGRTSATAAYRTHPSNAEHTGQARAPAAAYRLPLPERASHHCPLAASLPLPRAQR